jgi:2-oxoglutarate dehydrogenase E2 component (dihydrolipoamide succinyltransferase)
LVTPVIKDCHRKSIGQIEQELAAVSERARAGTITLGELQGGTFTVSNGGVFGSLLGTPILNPPQSAILGMHAIKDRPVVVDGAICGRPMMYLALTYDHRIIDGKDAATFLVLVKSILEQPERLLFQ